MSQTSSEIVEVLRMVRPRPNIYRAYLDTHTYRFELEMGSMATRKILRLGSSYRELRFVLYFVREGSAQEKLLVYKMLELPLTLSQIRGLLNAVTIHRKSYKNELERIVVERYLKLLSS